MEYTANDCLTTDILAAAVRRQNECAAAFKAVLNRDVALSAISHLLTNGVYTVPYPSLINVIENNLRELCDGGYRTDDVGMYVIWLGELDDAQRLSYKDVNRWFKSCEALERVMTGAARRAVITGRAAACGNRTLQIVRRL